MSLFKNWTTTDWGNDGDRFVEELTTYSRAIAKNPKKRPDMVNLKKSFKEMVRDVDEETLLDNIKLLKRTVTSKQDLLDVVNTPSMNDMKTVLHKQVKDQNVIKVAVLVRSLFDHSLISEENQPSNTNTRTPQHRYNYFRAWTWAQEIRKDKL